MTRFLWLLAICASWAAMPGPGRPPLPVDVLPSDLSAKNVPEGLVRLPPVPSSNPMSPEKVQLGRRLFFDPILSRDKTISCASCHDPKHGFASPDPVAIGIGGKKGKRNAPSLFNVDYRSSLFWDGRARTLEQQARLPITDPAEMGATVDLVLKRLRSDKGYPQAFAKAFGDKKITIEKLAMAIATFERALILGDSPVDRFRAGRASDLSRDAKLGLWLFESKARCWQCHSGPTFSDEKFHNTGIGWNQGDTGRYAITKKEADQGAFKTPSLRGVALSAPYMHNGSMKDLEEVIQHYNRGGKQNPYLSPKIKPLELTKEEIGHLVAFLKELTGRPAWK